jgi:hypothetical protein
MLRLAKYVHLLLEKRLATALLHKNPVERVICNK